MHIVEGAVKFVQYRANRLGRCAVHSLQLALVEGRRVHAARPLDHVVGLINQHTDAPLVAYRHGVQHGAGVKVIVVVAHHHVGPCGHLLRQVVGAHTVFQRYIAHGAFVQRLAACALHCRVTRSRQPVIKTLGQRA